MSSTLISKKLKVMGGGGGSRKKEKLDEDSSHLLEYEEECLPESHSPSSGPPSTTTTTGAPVASSHQLLQNNENGTVIDMLPTHNAVDTSSSSITIESNQSSSNGPANPSEADFIFIKIVARLVLQLLRRFWAFTSAAGLAIIIFYWYFGGIMAFFLLIFALTGILYHAGDRLLYHPDQPSTSRVFIPSPSMFGLEFENIYIKSKDSTRLHAYFVKQEPSKVSSVPTILYLHGNAGNIGHRLLNVKGLIQTLGCNVCLIEYRGYGHSDGTPTEDGLYLDAQAALDYLIQRSDIDKSKIVTFGRSLGGAVAIDLCSRAENRDKIACVLIENTFTSVPDIAKELFNFKIVRVIPRWFYKNQYKSKWKVCKMSTPCLFLSGSADALIPSKMMAELFNSCGSPIKRIAKFPGGTHNETWTSSQYYETITYFFQEVVKINGFTGSRERLTSPTPLIAEHNII